MRVESGPVAGFFGDGEVGVGESLHDELVGGDYDGAGRDGEFDGEAGACFGDDEVVICGEGGRDFFDVFAEFRAGGAEVELDFVIERAWRAGCEDFDGFDVEIFFEDVLEAASGFESDVVGGAQDHLRERLANFEFLCFARAESEFCECLDGCHLVA